MFMLKKVLQVSIYAEVVFDVQKLLSVGLRDFFRLFQFLVVVLFKFDNQALVLRTFMTLIHRAWASHFWSSILRDLRSWQLKLRPIIQIIPLYFTLRNLKQYFSLFIFMVW